MREGLHGGDQGHSARLRRFLDHRAELEPPLRFPWSVDSLRGSFACADYRNGVIGSTPISRTRPRRAGSGSKDRLSAKERAAGAGQSAIPNWQQSPPQGAEPIAWEISTASSHPNVVRHFVPLPDGRLGAEESSNMTEGPIRRLRELFHCCFLPKNYPETVSPDYTPWVKYQFLQGLAGSAAAVLSTQAMLHSIGITAGAAPLSATLNWALKDAFGSVWSIWASGKFGDKFDSTPKQWRMIGDMVYNVGMLLELSTILAPKYFLLIGSLATVCKGISMLSASATTATIHKSFAISENLGDVTCKAEAQRTLRFVLGSLAGVGIAAFGGATTIPDAFVAFASLATVHLWANYRAVRCVNLPHINKDRLLNLAHEFAMQRRISKPAFVNQMEPVLSTPTDRAKTVLFPRLLTWSRNHSADQAQKLHEDDHSILVTLGATLDSAFSSSGHLIKTIELYADLPYLLTICQPREDLWSSDGLCHPQVNIVFRHDIVASQLIQATLQAALVHKELLERYPHPQSKVSLSPQECWSITTRTLRLAVELNPQFIQELQNNGWRTSEIVMGSENSYRCDWKRRPTESSSVDLAVVEPLHVIQQDEQSASRQLNDPPESRLPPM